MKQLVAQVDGDVVRAPAPGWFCRTVEHDRLIAPGDVIGELVVLHRVSRVVCTARGRVKLEDRAARRAVGYGDVLFRIDTVGDGEPIADAKTATTAGGLVFRAPTSGRFYGRSTPDKPPFVQIGSELAAGTTLCLLEVMKTFHRVTYGGADVPARARVREILVLDGADVSRGDGLFALDPA